VEINSGSFINTKMEKESVTAESKLKTLIYISLSGVVHQVDIAVFKIVIDYIVRNFDPTGISIVGLIGSCYHVLIKRKLSSFVKMIQFGINRCPELSIKIRTLSLKPKFISHQSFILKCGCL